MTITYFLLEEEALDSQTFNLTREEGFGEQERR